MGISENVMGMPDKVMGICELTKAANAGAAWYCIRSQPRHEHIAAANLRRHHQIEVFIPASVFDAPRAVVPSG